LFARLQERGDVTYPEFGVSVKIEAQPSRLVQVNFMSIESVSIDDIPDFCGELEKSDVRRLVQQLQSLDSFCLSQL
jgi:hypothetical protein